MRVLRAVWKITRTALLALLALAVVAAGAFTLTQTGRDSLGSVVSDLVSSPRSRVRISGLAGIWSGHLRAREILFSDAGGSWLVLRGIEVDWRPLSLLGLTFSADRIHADQIELLRLPGPAGESDGKPFSLPVAVDLKTIDFPEVAIGEAVSGAAAQLSANGSAKAGGSPVSGQADLELKRTDGHQGQASAHVVYVPADGRLDVRIDGSEAADGIIASLLSLPGRPAVGFSVLGGGPASDWSGSGTLSVSGQVVVSLSGRRLTTDGGSLVEAKGNGNFAMLLPQELSAAAAGTTQFDIRAILGESGSIDIEDARLQSDALSATAKGRFDPNGVSDLEAETHALAQPVMLATWSGATAFDVRLRRAEIRAFGPADSLGVDVSAQLAEAGTAEHRAQDLSVALKSDALDLSRRSGRLDVTTSAASAGSVNQFVAGLLAGRVELAAVVDLSSDQIAFQTGKASTGSVQGSARGTYSLADGALSADFRAEVLSTVLPSATRAALDRSVAVSGRVERTKEGTISVSGIEASSGPLSVAGNAAYEPDAISATFDGTLDDVSRLTPKAQGSVRFSVSATGAPAIPEISVSLSSDRIDVAGQAIEGLKVEADGKADTAAPSGHFRLTGTVDGKPLAGQGTLAPKDGRATMEDLRVTLGPNVLSGQITLADGFVPDGAIDFDFPEIAPLAALALLDAQGSAKGSLRLEAGAHPKATLNSTVHSLAMANVNAGEVRVSAMASDYLGSPALEGTLSAERVVAGKVELSDISFDFNQDGEWTAFDGGLKVNGSPANARGRARPADGWVEIELADASAVLGDLAATLARPTVISAAGSALRLNDLTIAADGGAVSITGSAGPALDLDIRLASLPAAVLNQFVGSLDARGTLSGAVQVKGSASSPKAVYQAEWKAGQVAQTRQAGFGSFDLTSNGTFADNRLAFTARVAEGSGLGLDGQGTVNVATKALDLTMSGKVPFGFLAQRLAAQGVGLEGSADVSLRASGHLLSPQLSGTLKTSGARLIHVRSGIAVNALAADVKLGGGVASIERLSGALASGGTITGSGTIGIDPAKGFPADLSLSLDNGRYTDGSLVAANLDGKVKVTGPLTAEPLLSGTVNLARTVVTIPERLPPSLDALDVKHRNAPTAVSKQQAALKPAGGGGAAGGLRFDLTINAPQQIFVQGRGLDAELGGSLKLTGPAASPEAVGRFDLRRGRLDLLGRRLQFTSGSIGFSGSLVPYLNLRAESSASDATVSVLVTGPANNPAFAFESSPALPQDEILARLVFGRAMSGLSPLQIAQLAAAAGQLAGLGGPTTLLQNLREQTGLDDIDVKTDDKTGDTSLSVGKYLNDKTYLSIEKGSQAGSGKATIDLEIGKGLKLRGEASDSGKTRGGVFYEKEY